MINESEGENEDKKILLKFCLPIEHQCQIFSNEEEEILSVPKRTCL